MCDFVGRVLFLIISTHRNEHLPADSHELVTYCGYLATKSDQLTTRELFCVQQG